MQLWSMGQGGYKIREQNGVHFITFAVVEWVDVFTRHVYSDIVVESLKFCQKSKGLNIHAWVIMSNHLHLILSARENYQLSSILGDFKKFTAKTILAELNKNKIESRRSWMTAIFRSIGAKNSRNEINQFWRQENHPIHLYSQYMIDQKMNYLHNNPVKAKIVDKPEEYIYSSARDYARRQGLIKIDFLNP